MTGWTYSKQHFILRPIPHLSGRFRGYRCGIAVLIDYLLYKYLKSSHIGVSVNRGKKDGDKDVLLVSLFVVFMVHSCAGPLNQLNSLIKTNYGEETLEEDLIKAGARALARLTTCFLMAQVRLFVLCYCLHDARIKSSSLYLPNSQSVFRACRNFKAL